jgi:uncharacterized protein (TIGR03067 family)
MYLSLLTAVVVLAAPAPEKKDADLIQGKWSVASFERKGETKPDEKTKNAKVVFDGNTITIKEGDREEKATYKIDPDKKPKTIDITPEKGEKVAGIYELKGDELKICFGKPGTERPTEFNSKGGTEQTVIVLKREKK